MTNVSELITSATDFARKAKQAGMRVVGLGAAEPENPADKGTAELGRITETMVATEGWQALKVVLQARRERLWRTLSGCKPEDLVALQVEARVIDELIALPDQWIEDGREAAQRMSKAQAQEKGVA